CGSRRRRVTVRPCTRTTRGRSGPSPISRPRRNSPSAATIQCRAAAMPQKELDVATKKRGGLGRGISALIPQSTAEGDRPVDVFFPAQGEAGETPAAKATREAIDRGLHGPPA